MTDDWYAQDDQGNVWYLGEYVTNYEDGKVADHAGSFEAGVDGAQAGIAMPAKPEPGLAYRQEYLEGEAEDNGEVIALDLTRGWHAAQLAAQIGVPPVVVADDGQGFDPASPTARGAVSSSIIVAKAGVSQSH